MSPLIQSLGIALALGIGWHLSGIWRGTTRRGYLLALDHVEEMTSRGPAGTSVPDALRVLREETRTGSDRRCRSLYSERERPADEGEPPRRA